MSGPQHARRWVVTAHTAVLMVATAGCATVGSDVTSGACVSWVEFPSPADAMAQAAMVVRTTGQAASVGTNHMFGIRVAVHSVEVADVLKGTELRVGQDVEVLSTPVTCTGGAVYPDGDPLDASGPLIVFLQWDADAHAWRTLTPGQGVVAATGAGDLPSTWPAPAAGA
jgi:hypothetical protein